MKDGVFFLGILILFFVVWVASGGPSRPISFAGPYLNPITTSGTTAQPYGDPAKFSSINSTVTVGPNGVDTTSNSPSAGTVTLSHDLSGVTSTDPSSEYIAISVAAGSGASVSTAGWKLVSKANNAAAALPQGTEVANSGRVNTLSPITLRPGEQAIVTTGRSPVGISFRENKCTGYFEEHQDFHPSLMMSCPTPSQEFSRFYTGDDTNDRCINYVRSIAYCSTEVYGDPDTSSSCEDFVEEHLNYNSCVAAHKGDADFSGTVWRVFLGQRNELWRRDRETITLLDAQNRVIDSISY